MVKKAEKTAEKERKRMERECASKERRTRRSPASKRLQRRWWCVHGNGGGGKKHHCFQLFAIILFLYVV
jgi:hypothetical protein